MPRKIKFRAWDKEKNKMVINSWRMKIDMFGNILWSIDHYDGTLNLIEREEINGNDRFELMQFTGLRDSKRTAEYPEGQEIYEGDIVHCLGGEYCQGYWEFDYKFEVKFDPEQWPYLTETEHTEVIGNIYDNPTLLGGQPDAE